MSTWPAPTQAIPSPSTSSSSLESTPPPARSPSSTSSACPRRKPRHPLQEAPWACLTSPHASSLVRMPRLPLLAALLSPAVTLHAADVHVRVDPSARMAAPGNENLATFPTIINTPHPPPPPPPPTPTPPH